MNSRTWGVTAEECASPFPCDALGFAHDDVYLRGIAIAAPAALVFRWLCQLRVAPYSYDLLDNFGRPSPSRLTPGADALQVGGRVMHLFRIAAFEHGRSLTCRLDSRLYRAVLGDLAGSYRIDPDPGGSRLLAKILVRYPAGPHGAMLRAALPGLDLVMFRKQLVRLKAFAERDAAS